MPANYIPISSAAGKLFARMSAEPGKKPINNSVENDGLVAILDFNGTKTLFEPTTASFNQ